MNIRNLITHLEQIAKLSGEEQVVEIFDPDALDWFPITGFLYGGGDNVVRIYTEE